MHSSWLRYQWYVDYNGIDITKQCTYGFKVIEVW